MENIANKYRRLVLTSLIKLFVKAAFVQETYVAFPYIMKLNLIPNDVESNAFFLHWQTFIKEKYMSQIVSISQVYFQPQEIDNIVSSALKEVIVNLSTIQVSKIDVISELLDSFLTYDSESSNHPIILDERYKTSGTFYFERFFRITDYPYNHDLSNEQLYQSIVHRDQKFKNIVSFKDMRDFISVVDSHAFVEAIQNVEIGLRLIYLPNFPTLTPNELAILKNDEKAIQNKTNLIEGKFVHNGPSFSFYPLVVAQTLHPLSNAFFIIKQIVEVPGFAEGFAGNDLKNNLTSELDFRKIFHYAFPIFSFELVLLFDWMNKLQLLSKVYQDNLVYSNFGETLIKVIDHLANAENPNKL